MNELTRFNNIDTQATAQMAVDKESVCLSRVHAYESKCIMPDILAYSVHKLLLACTQSADNVFHYFTVTWENEG